MLARSVTRPLRFMLLFALLVAIFSLPGPARASPAVPSQVVVGQFQTPCLFSHRAPDDPIMFPRQPGLSHSHDFLGNVSTDAFSTLTRLRSAGTRCYRLADTSAYWVPTLYQDGKAIAPEESAIYYVAANKEPRSIEAFPAGLRVIAGDSHATEPQDPTIVDWHCEILGIPTGGPVPRCAPGVALVVTITFPDCWDGRRLDSPDHKAHLAYAEPGSSGRQVCPASHPVPVPRISLNVRYLTPGGAGVELSSGPVYTAHADFFNAWDQAALESLVRHCINENRVCSRDEDADTGLV